MAGVRLRVTEPTPPVEEGLRTAVSTGTMLGGGRDTRKVYVAYDGGAWEETYSHPQNTPESAGKLMNLRMVQAAIRNATGTEAMSEADAEANTDTFVAWLDEYRSHGIMAMTVGMEGGGMAKSIFGDRAEIDQTGFAYDGTTGSCSAFDAAGALKASYQARLEQIIEAMDAQGMVCILNLFYGRQSFWLDTQAGYEAAMDATAAWLKAKGYRNVMVDLANEAAASGVTDDASSTWNSATTDMWSVDTGTRDAMIYWQDLWTGEPWRPPSGVSSRRLTYSATVLPEVDVVLVHGNLGGKSESGVAALVTATASNPVPLVCNEDENSQISGAVSSSLADEETSCSNMFDGGVSHGAMVGNKSQVYHSDSGPSDGFWWEIGTGEDLSTGTAREKWAKYMRGYCNHVESLTGGLPALP